MYDFNQIVNRENTGSAKWNEIVQSSFPPLTTADMEWKTCPEVIKALEERAVHGIFGYTKPDNYFYQAIIDWIKKRHQYIIEKEEIICTTSVIPAIITAIHLCSKQGEGVILFNPVYTGFYHAISSAGRKVIECPLIEVNQQYQIDFEDFLTKAQDRSNSVLLFCNPHNPVGKVFKKEELERVAQICLENNLKIISDEIHADLILKGRHIMFASLSKECAANTITCMSPSKTFNLAGLQTAYCIISNEQLREQFCKQLRKNGHMEVISAFGYTATISAYQKGDLWLEKLIDSLKQNINLITEKLTLINSDIKVNLIEGTYLAWLDFRKWNMSQEEILINFRKKGIYLTDGRVFGENGKGFLRMNFAMPYCLLEKVLVQFNLIK